MLHNYMLHNDILHQTSFVDTPSRNGVVEWKVGVFLKLLQLSCLLQKYRNIFGLMLFLPHVSSLTTCHPPFFVDYLHFMSFSHFSLCFLFIQKCLVAFVLSRMFVIISQNLSKSLKAYFWITISYKRVSVLLA